MCRLRPAPPIWHYYVVGEARMQRTFTLAEIIFAGIAIAQDLPPGVLPPSRVTRHVEEELQRLPNAAVDRQIRLVGTGFVFPDHTGFITAAGIAGVSAFLIAQQTGHKSLEACSGIACSRTCSNPTRRQKSAFDTVAAPGLRAGAPADCLAPALKFGRAR